RDRARALVDREVRDHPGRKDIGVEAGMLETGEGALHLRLECVGCGHRRECTRAGGGGSTRPGTGLPPAGLADDMRWVIVPLTLQLPSPGETMCALRSVLRDRDTGRRLGEILAQDLEEGIRPMTVLNECARDVGDAIYRQLH